MTIQTRIYYTENYHHESHSYVAPVKARLRDILRYVRNLERAGYSAWFEFEERPDNCPACWHLIELHGSHGCMGKVYPAYSLTGELCPCTRRTTGRR